MMADSLSDSKCTPSYYSIMLSYHFKNGSLKRTARKLSVSAAWYADGTLSPLHEELVLNVVGYALLRREHPTPMNYWGTDAWVRDEVTHLCVALRVPTGPMLARTEALLIARRRRLA